MSRNKPLILTSLHCSCRVIPVPPVGDGELEQIIRHRMSAFYPGSPDELYRDFIREGDNAVLFYAQVLKIDALREEKGNSPLYAPWHLFSALKNKKGYYAVEAGLRYDLYQYKDDRLEDVRTVDSLPEGEDVQLFPLDRPVSRRAAPLFQKKRKKNYLLINLVLITLVILLPQLAFYRQTRLDEHYAAVLKKEIARLTVEKAGASESEEEYARLLGELEKLEARRPINIVSFLSELSAALGRDVAIDTLVLKEGSFQLNGEGLNPLGKMERFQDNSHFSAVLPYQVKSIDNSSRESFSLTGFYGDE